MLPTTRIASDSTIFLMATGIAWNVLTCSNSPKIVLNELMLNRSHPGRKLFNAHTHEMYAAFMFALVNVLGEPAARLVMLNGKAPGVNFPVVSTR